MKEELKRVENPNKTYNVFNTTTGKYLPEPLCQKYGIGDSNKTKFIKEQTCHKITDKDLEIIKQADNNVTFTYEPIFDLQIVLSFTVYVDKKHNDKLYILNNMCEKYGIKPISKRIIKGSTYCNVTEGDIKMIEEKTMNDKIILKKKYEEKEFDDEIQPADNLFMYYYDIEDKKIYIQRNILELAKQNNIEIEGTPKIIDNKNCYSITEAELKEIENKTNYRGVEKVIRPKLLLKLVNEKLDIENSNTINIPSTEPTINGPNKIIIFKDIKSKRIYANESVIKRFNIKSPTNEKIIVNGEECYEVNQEDAIFIAKSANNVYSPYAVTYEELPLGLKEIKERNIKPYDNNISSIRDIKPYDNNVSSIRDVKPYDNNISSIRDIKPYDENISSIKDTNNVSSNRDIKPYDNNISSIRDIKPYDNNVSSIRDVKPYDNNISSIRDIKPYDENISSIKDTNNVSSNRDIKPYDNNISSIRDIKPYDNNVSSIRDVKPYDNNISSIRDVKPYDNNISSIRDVKPYDNNISSIRDVKPYDNNISSIRDIKPYNDNISTIKDIGADIKPYDDNITTAKDLSINIQPYDESISSIRDIKPYDNNISSIRDVKPYDNNISSIRDIKPYDENISSIKDTNSTTSNRDIKPYDEKISSIRDIKPYDNNISTIRNIRPYDENVSSIRDIKPYDENISSIRDIRPYNDEISKINKEEPKTDVVIVYRDSITKKLYISEENALNTSRSSKKIMNKVCYETTEEELKSDTTKKYIVTDVFVTERESLDVIICNNNGKLFVSKNILNTLNFYIENPHKIKVNKEIYEEITPDDIELIKERETKALAINIILKHITPTKKRG